MSKFLLEKFSSNKIGKKYIFSQRNSNNWEGPNIEYYPAINTTKYGIYSKDGKYKFELKINNKEGNDYTIRVCNKDGYPTGLTMVVMNGYLYFGKFSSRDGFNGIVYCFKKGENVKIQKYIHGLLINESTFNYILTTEVAVPLPFECLIESGEVLRRTITNPYGDFVEFIVGNPNGNTCVLGASIDSEGAITIGQYYKDFFNGLALRYLPNGVTSLKLYSMGIPNGEFEIIYNDKIINDEPVSGFSYILKKENDPGYINLVCLDKNGKMIMEVMELNSNKKRIKDKAVKLPSDVALNQTESKNNTNQPQNDAKSSGEEKLNNLIGLENVKKEIKKLKAIIRKFNNSVNKPNLNMVFYGNPGTGKTEVARIIASILYEEGILPSNKCVEVDSSGLIAEYVGQTAIKTHEAVQEAMGGVLFIDEAYMLNSGEYKGGSFGEEAITALLKDMEDYRGKLCIILAGYKQPMEKMMEINPGFTSRINRYIDFPDYSLDELRQITLLMYKDKGYEMEDQALDEIIKILNKLKENSIFANAREVRNLLDSIYEIQALRTSDTPSDLLITLSDILEYEKDHNLSFNSKTKKIDWHIDPNDFLEYSNNQSIREINTSYIESCCVNIKCFNDGKLVGEGTGFFISPKGIIGTCAHVVNDADKIIVIVNIQTLSGQIIQKDYTAEVITSDETADVALIGLINPDLMFPYYSLPLPQSGYPKLMTKLIMGGYPFGGNRFENITITEGKVQSINKDNILQDNIVKLFVDISGQPGSSGSGVLDFNNCKCIGIFAGAAIHDTGNIKLTINYAIPIDYLWNLILNYKPIIKMKSNNILDAYGFVKSNENQCRIDINYNLKTTSKIKNEKPLYNNVHIIVGDVSTFRGDAVVNAANKYLAPGAGVCGAIFDRAGYDSLLEECRKIGECEVGNAVITNGYKLDAQYIIHAVGPHYLHDLYPEDLLKKLYKNIFELAIKHNIKSIALPSISTGAFKFPIEKAVKIASKVIKKYSINFDNIYIYCLSIHDNIYIEYKKEFKQS